MTENPAETIVESRSYKYLDYITGIFVAVLLISNTASVKILNLGWFAFDGGTILFPLAYIFGDILTEVYGYRRSRRVIWTGFFSIILMAVVYAIVGYLPAAEGWGMQDAYMSILGIVPRIVLAKMKVWMNGKYLWMRTISSTIVGEGVDTALFVLIAFAGTMPTSLLVAIIVSNYVFKVGVEVLFTPITYAIVNFLKRKEHEDYYDKNTNFNPFAVQ
jgi:uncharacterized PurR-regulated membrane protein YhhQ (DUF165 family)